MRERESEKERERDGVGHDAVLSEDDNNNRGGGGSNVSRTCWTEKLTLLFRSTLSPEDCTYGVATWSQ